MDIVIEIVAPVFGLVLLGYGAVKLGLFGEQAASGLSRFVFDFAIPAYLFRTFATTDLPESIPWGLYGSFYLAVLGVYGFGMALGVVAFRRDFMGATLTGMGCAFGNTVLLGLPIVLRTFGDEGAVPMFLILAVHGLILMTLTTVLLEFGRNAGAALSALPGQVARGLVTNPLLMGLALGLAFNLMDWRIPGVIDDVCRLLQGAVAPAALFAMGATLASYGFAGRLTQSIVVLSAKMLLLPLAVWLLATFVFDLPPVWAMVATLAAAQPTGVNVYLFASRYGTAQAISSSTIFLSTAFSVLSISAILYLFDVR